MEVAVDAVPRYEALAAEVAALAARGSPLTAIASALGQTRQTVRDALRFARRGERPKRKPSGRRTGTGGKETKYIPLAREVVRLRDEEQMPFRRIAARLGVSEATTRRAYDHAHRDDVRRAAQAGRRVARGRYVLVEMGTRRAVVERLAQGMAVAAVAAEVGCNISTVYRIRAEQR